MGFVDSFIADYLRDFAQCEQEVANTFKHSFEDLCSTVDSRCADFLNSIARLKQFSHAMKSKQEFQSELHRIEGQIQSFTFDRRDTRDRFAPLQINCNEMLRVFQSGLETINRKVEDLYYAINTSAQGRPEDGVPFQSFVLDFLDVVFIHELMRDSFPRTQCKRIKMDGLYNKLATFNANERTGFAFDKLLVECKNKKPGINDLMQCLKYTLCYQTTEISKIPLVLLICRIKPGPSSSIWEINKKIFDKQIAAETRLILILTLDDLSEMKQLKIDGLDPAKVIRDKIAEFS